MQLGGPFSHLRLSLKSGNAESPRIAMLKNARRERGAIALYTGKSDKEAMEAAGYVYSAPNGRRFRNSPDIRQRLRELFEADRPFLLLDALECRNERRAIIKARMSNYYEDVLDDQGMPTVDDKGEPVMRFKGFAKLTDEQVAAIASIKQTKAGYEIKLHEKDASLRAREARVDPLPQRVLSDGDDDSVPVDDVARWDETPSPGVRAN